MKRSHKIAAGLAVSLSLGLATAAYAHRGDMGAGTGQHAKEGVQHDMKHGMEGGAMRGHEGQRHGAQLMSPDERAALHEKMRSATPEERRKLAAATRAEMQKRAQEQGITLHEHRGAPAGTRSAPQAPAASEHVN